MVSVGMAVIAALTDPCVPGHSAVMFGHAGLAVSVASCAAEVLVVGGVLVTLGARHMMRAARDREIVRECRALPCAGVVTWIAIGGESRCRVIWIRR